MKKTAPTLRDVAAASNVSIATVSKYINGTQRFSAKVEAAIDAAIASLGYKSNPLAKSMITGRTDTIGLSVLDITNPHFSSILKGAQRVANDHGMSVLVVDTEENPSRERRVLEDLSRRVDGMIVASRLRERTWAGWPTSTSRWCSSAPWPSCRCRPWPATTTAAPSCWPSTWMLGHRASPTSAFRSRAATRSAWAASANAWTPPACRSACSMPTAPRWPRASACARASSWAAIRRTP
jgi:transcriptional regulator with XRE-family HTH domain